jgi:Ca2+-binding RTX toxin-like protein
MLQIRHLGAAVALLATMSLAMASVASAHPGQGPWDFDHYWIGTPGDDVYSAAAESPDTSDLLIGLAGNDNIDGGNKHDVILGNAGVDAITGGDGRDLIIGGLGPDRLAGGEQSDRILGGPGDDGINGQGGRDVILAGSGDDLIIANDGRRDAISCGPGRDSVKADRRDRIARDCERVVRVAP